MLLLATIPLGYGVRSPDSPPSPPPPAPPPPPSPPPPPPPPPGTGGAFVTRSGTALAYDGQALKLWGPNWPMFDGWDSNGQGPERIPYMLDEVQQIKTLWAANCIRLVISPNQYKARDAEGLFWSTLDAILDKIAEVQMFAIIDYWVVGWPGGGAQFGADTSIALWHQFWTLAAARYKDRGNVIFHPWDEPSSFLSTPNYGSTLEWPAWAALLQPVVNIIRGASAPNLISIPGTHFNRAYIGWGANPIVDTLSPAQFMFGYNEFEIEDNYTFYNDDTAGVGRLDAIFPMAAGGWGYGSSTPITATQPSSAAFRTWIDTYVVGAFAGNFPWVHSSISDPQSLQQLGAPYHDVVPTFTNMGAYQYSKRYTGLVYATPATPPPPPPPPPSPPTPPSDIGAIVPLTSANVWVDSVGGNDARDGTSDANSVKTWARVSQLMGPGKTLAIKRNSFFNTEGTFTANGWSNAIVGAYGDSGSRPEFRNSRTYTGGFTFVRAKTNCNVYRVNIGSWPQSSAYAAARVSFPTIVIVNDTQILTWYSRNGEGDIGNSGRTDMFWHSGTGGDLYFSCVGTPTKVEVPRGDVMNFSNCTGITIQDLAVNYSHGHCVIMSKGQENFLLQRLHISKSGTSGIYIQPRDNAGTNNVRVFGCLCEDIHAEGIVLSSDGQNPVGFQNLDVRANIIRRVCKGPPFIIAGTRSQDFYSAGIKVYTEGFTNFPSSGYIRDNLIEDIGDLGTPYYFAPGGYAYNGSAGYESNQAQGIWPDSVNGALIVTNNTIRRTWAAGVFVENSPGRPHVVEYNFIEDCGQQPVGWTGGICLGRNESGAIVRHNTIVRCRNGGIVLQGSRTDQFVEDLDIRDNLIICESANPFVWERTGRGNASTDWTNNAFWNASSPQWRWLSGTNGSLDATFWSTPATYATVGAWSTARGGLVSGSVTADPLVNASYVPQIGSPLINAASDGLDIGKEQT